jgi:hypothetical protein
MLFGGSTQRYPGSNPHTPVETFHFLFCGLCHHRQFLLFCRDLMDPGVRMSALSSMLAATTMSQRSEGDFRCLSFWDNFVKIVGGYTKVHRQALKLATFEKLRPR